MKIGTYMAQTHGKKLKKKAASIKKHVLLVLLNNLQKTDLP